MTDGVLIGEQDRLAFPSSEYRSNEAPEGPAIFEEVNWREPFRGVAAEISACEIDTSRWTAAHGSDREVTSITPAHCHLITISLKASRVRLLAGQNVLFDGLMPSGTVYISLPGQQKRARFAPPFDFLHLHVENRLLCREGLISDESRAVEVPSPVLFRDPLAEALGRSLVDLGEHCHPQYVASVSKAIVMRTMTRRQNGRRCSALPKWRLRKLEQFLAGKIDGPISLLDMATAAGLSKMHFAAQFRAATGFRPHEYLMFRRVEQAKVAMSETRMPLVEIALAVGFNAQAHFSTVFKRFTGKSPAQWKQEHLAIKAL